MSFLVLFLGTILLKPTINTKLGTMDTQDTARLEGKSNKSWLWVLLLLILLALVAYAFTKTPKDDSQAIQNTVNNNQNTVQQQQQPQDTTIRNLTEATAGISAKTANGKRFELNNVRVTKFVGDTTFWVDDGANGNIFVQLQNNLDAGQAEQRVQIKEGQLINLAGTITSAPMVDQAKTQWQLNDADAMNINNTGSYFLAERVSISQ